MSVKLAKFHLTRNNNNRPSSSYSMLFKTNLNIYHPSSQKNSKLNESQPQQKFKSNDIPHFHKILSSSHDKNSFQNKNDISNNTDFIDKISFIPSDYYSSILSKLEYIFSTFKEDQAKLNNILINIENTINQIIQEAIINYKNSENTPKILHKSSSESGTNTFKSTFYTKIKSKGKFNTSQDINDYEQENNSLKNKIKHLYKKINDIENKFKTEKLNYLFCIGQYQSKINLLEEKINLDSIDKMPKEELKKLICFPHYIKFEVKEDINPKSVPMSIENNKKHKCKSSYRFRGGKNTNLSDTGNITNSIEGSSQNLINNYNIIESFDDNEKIKIDDLNIAKSKDFIEETKKIIEYGKQNFDAQVPVFEKFVGKRKKYFVSHPKISYVRFGKDFKLKSRKLNNQLDNLPKSISKLKTCTKSQKNAIVVFPSSFNETVVNLEKLRIKDTFKNIVNKFEESLKQNKSNKALDCYFHVNDNDSNI